MDCCRPCCDWSNVRLPLPPPLACRRVLTPLLAMVLLLSGLLLSPLYALAWQELGDMLQGRASPWDLLPAAAAVGNGLLALQSICHGYLLLALLNKRYAARPAAWLRGTRASGVLAAGGALLLAALAAKSGVGDGAWRYQLALLALAAAALTAALLAGGRVAMPPAGHVPVSLRITLDNGAVLLAVAAAQRRDFMVTTRLLGGEVTRDLYSHYQAFIQAGCGRYVANDCICQTMVKHGEAIQDKLPICISIELPAAAGRHGCLDG